MEKYFTSLDTPVGKLWLTASADALCTLSWRKGSLSGMEEQSSHPVLRAAVKQLKEYFSGKRKSFDLPLKPEGTEFQMRVWRELSRIPYGETISYGEQAKRVGDKNAARAVGSANGRNPIPIIVPCHRVISGSGIGGFGGGLKAKRILLSLESGQESLFKSS